MPISQPPPTVKLGAAAREVSRAGLGGPPTPDLLEAALAAGITYVEAGQAPADAFWAKHPAERERAFLAGKTAFRDGGGARRQLEEALDRLDTDRLDLWWIDDLRTMDDLEELLHPGGALDTLERARDKGLIRQLGVACAADPAVLLRAVAELPLDVAALPVNPAEGAVAGFADVRAAARAKGLGLVGTHVLGGAGRLVQAGLDPARLLAYAFAQDVDVLRVGARTEAELAMLVAASHAPLDEVACRAFEAELRPRAGQLLTWRGPLGPAC